MKAYLDILRNVLENGQPKQPVRFNAEGKPVPVENGTIGTFCEIFRHDMSKGFPLLTTKKMAFKTLCIELEGFIKGITDKEWYKSRGCKIWNEWANPVVVDQALEDAHNKVGYIDRKHIQEATNDLGPIYGYQWRKFGKHYGEWKFEDVGEPNSVGECQTTDNRNGVDEGFDQLKTIADRLRENPHDRRMFCSAWNPNQTHLMALPPCHIIWNVVVYGNKLNLTFLMRSTDYVLGAPFNIASYAILLKLLAKHAKLEEGELVGIFSDCHIYDNHIEQAKLQLTREPLPLPFLELTHDGDIFNWTHEDVKLIDYKYHPPIKAEITV